jgi:hypothetical protein
VTPALVELDEVDELLTDLDGALDESGDEVDTLIRASVVENAQGGRRDGESESKRRIQCRPNLARAVGRSE